MDEPTGTLREDEVRGILEQRALAYAAPQKKDFDKGTKLVLMFQVGTERYGIDVQDVCEVHPAGALTPVPGLPSFWAGLVNVRGALHPALDAAAYLGVESDLRTRNQLLIISSGEMVIGLLVDEVLGLRRIGPQETGTAPEQSLAHNSAVYGATPDLLLLLDVRTMLVDPALLVETES